MAGLVGWNTAREVHRTARLHDSSFWKDLCDQDAPTYRGIIDVYFGLATSGEH